MSAFAHALLKPETQCGHTSVQRSLALLSDVALPLGVQRKILDHLRKYVSYIVSASQTGVRQNANRRSNGKKPHKNVQLAPIIFDGILDCTADEVFFSV